MVRPPGLDPGPRAGGGPGRARRGPDQHRTWPPCWAARQHRLPGRRRRRPGSRCPRARRPHPAPVEPDPDPRDGPRAAGRTDLPGPEHPARPALSPGLITGPDHTAPAATNRWAGPPSMAYTGRRTRPTESPRTPGDATMPFSAPATRCAARSPARRGPAAALACALACSLLLAAAAPAATLDLTGPAGHRHQGQRGGHGHPPSGQAADPRPRRLPDRGRAAWVRALRPGRAPDRRLRRRSPCSCA